MEPFQTQVKYADYSQEFSFFEDTLKDYCDITYGEVSLIDLIPDAEVRAILTDARKKFLDGDKFAALIDLQVALHKLEGPEGKYLPRINAPKAPTMPSEMKRAGWGTYLEQLHSFLTQVEVVVNALRFGVDPVRYTDFVHCGPTLQWSVTGKFTAFPNRTFDDMSVERFDELVAFLIDYALKISDSYISRPVRRIPFTAL